MSLSFSVRRRGRLFALLAMLTVLMTFAILVPPVAAQDEWTFGEASDLSVDSGTGTPEADAPSADDFVEDEPAESDEPVGNEPDEPADDGAPVDSAAWDVVHEPGDDDEPPPGGEEPPPATSTPEAAAPTAAANPTTANPTTATPVPANPPTTTPVPAPGLTVEPATVQAPSSAPQPAAFPPSEPDGPAKALWDLGEGEPLVLTGYTDTKRFDLSLPAGWKATTDPTFLTSIVASEIARSDASLRVDIAGRPATTWTLADTSNVVLPLEASMLDGDGLQIVATTTSPLIVEVACTDPNHVGRWVDLGAPSVQAQIAASDLDVARAVRGMAAVSELTREPINIVIRGEMTPTVLETAGALAAAIGRHGTPSGWVVTEGNGVLAPTGSSVVIEEDPSWPGEIAIDSTGIRPVLTLSGAGEDLTVIANALADPARLLFFHQQRVGIESVPASSGYRLSDVASFADAGYGDRTVRGSGTQGLVYRVRVPAGVAADSVTLAVRATYAPSLANTEAIISVSINGEESEIVAVADPSGRLEVLHPIDPDDVRPGLNFVRIDTQLGSVSGLGCSTSGDVGTEAWLTVVDSTAIGIARSSEEGNAEISIEDTRFALASAVDFAQTDVTLPDNASVLDLSVAVRVISDLAQRTDGGAPRLIKDADLDPTRHVVAVGTSTGRALLQSLPYSNSEPVGLIVAQASPFAAGRMFFALTGGTDADAARAASVAMSSEVADLTATTALVSRDTVRELNNENGLDRLENFGVPPEDLAFAEREGAPGPAAEDYQDWLDEQAARVKEQNAPQTEARRAVALGLLLLAAIVGGLWWIKRLRANDDDEAPAH